MTSARLKAPDAQKIVGGRERKDEAGAHRLQVEGRAMGDTERVLDRHGCRRESVVRGRGRQHDQVDRLGVDAGIGERGVGGLDREMRGELVVGRDMAFADTGPLHDPLIGSVDAARQLGIGQYPLRQVGTAAEHHRT